MKTHEMISGFLEERLDTLYMLAEKLTTLSVGALALTVTFLKDARSWVLKTAWDGFILVIVAFVILYLARIELYDRLSDSAVNSKDLYIGATQPWYFKIALYALLAGFIIGVGFLAFYGFTY